MNSRLASYIQTSKVVSIISNMSQSTIALNIPANTNFGPAERFFTLQNHMALKRIIIGDDNLAQVYKFAINSLPNLQALQIGKNCFTTEKNSKSDNPHRSFQIQGCPQLVSISIGCYSFSDYGGAFEIKNCGALKHVQIGEVGSESNNFYEASFILRGNAI